MGARIIRPKTVSLCPGALQLTGLIHFAQPWIERARTDRKAVAAQFSHHGCIPCAIGSRLRMPIVQ